MLKILDCLCSPFLLYLYNYIEVSTVMLHYIIGLKHVKVKRHTIFVYAKCVPSKSKSKIPIQ